MWGGARWPGGYNTPAVVLYHLPNPLDLFFYAGDVAVRRLGLPGTNSQVCLELGGALDVAGLRHALSALYRMYPAAGAVLDPAPLTGRPRWRMGTRPFDMNRVVRVHDMETATPEAFHQCTEDLIAEHLELRSLPPMRFDVFRGLPDGDRLVVRWPHAFMDGRGGVTLLEETQRLYEEKATPGQCTSAGDENRDDFGELLARGMKGRSALQLLKTSAALKPDNWQTARLVPGLQLHDLGPCRYLMRKLTPDQARRAQEISMRVCGFARFGDFIRATAIRSLHRVMPKPLPPGTGYTTLNLIDHRRKRQPWPICHNFTNTLPIHIPADIAEDRKAIADTSMEQSTQLIGTGAPMRKLLTIKQMTRLPMSLLVNIIHRSMLAARADRMPPGMGNAPSMPLAYTGSFSRAMPTFCGAPLVNIFGLRPIPFQTGMAIDLNEAQGRLNVCGMYYPSRVDEHTMTRLVDGFVEGLLNAD